MTAVTEVAIDRTLPKPGAKLHAVTTSSTRVRNESLHTYVRVLTEIARCFRPIVNKTQRISAAYVRTHTSVLVGVEKIDGGIKLLFGQYEGLAGCRAACRAAREKALRLGRIALSEFEAFVVPYA